MTHLSPFVWILWPEVKRKMQKRKIVSDNFPFRKVDGGKLNESNSFVFFYFRYFLLSKLEFAYLVSCFNLNGYIEFHHILSHSLSSSQILILIFRNILLFCLATLICVFLAVFNIKGRRAFKKKTQIENEKIHFIRCCHLPCDCIRLFSFRNS